MAGAGHMCIFLLPGDVDPACSPSRGSQRRSFLTAVLRVAPRGAPSSTTSSVPGAALTPEAPRRRLLLTLCNLEADNRPPAAVPSSNPPSSPREKSGMSGRGLSQKVPSFSEEVAQEDPPNDEAASRPRQELKAGGKGIAVAT
eukprot:CAMPEP_0115165546 /NCGR_PEP_ID=MMETSP0227-20121206/73653_1 /TAXON_ID=89957 /ORGANISM="Polarella glacialis, Strain CCMP 1383" /LENGTH=142 /DNA_ID=CAMNT_0002578031 /DNA_START=164 /DNA_END=589 /DNA_ORIENTATION=+